MTAINYNRYQTFSARLGASLIDGLIFLPVFYVVSLIFPGNYDDSIPGMVLINGLYFIYSITGHHRFGHTVGKYCCSVKVVQYRDETKLLTLAQAFKRDSIGMAFLLFDIFSKLFNLSDTDFGIWVSFLAGFGWIITDVLTMLIDKKRRSVHDHIAGSVCIDVRKQAALEKKYSS